MMKQLTGFIRFATIKYFFIFNFLNCTFLFHNIVEFQTETITSFQDVLERMQFFIILKPHSSDGFIR